MVLKNKYSYGQRVYEEGDASKYIYLIRKGDFEVNKDVHLIKNPNDDKIYGVFNRIYSNKDKSVIQLFFNKSSQILYSFKDMSEIYKQFSKLGLKKAIKICIRSEGDQLGLTDSFFWSPMHTSSATCVSKEGELFAIHKEHFFKKIRENNTQLGKVLINAITLIDLRIRNFFGVNNVINYL